jgi:hypothetical protein
VAAQILLGFQGKNLESEEASVKFSKIKDKNYQPYFGLIILPQSWLRFI